MRGWGWAAARRDQVGGGCRFAGWAAAKGLRRTEAAIARAVAAIGKMHGGTWRAYADHRMATAGAVLGLVVDGVEVDDIGATTKTLPDFGVLWSQMLAG